MLTSPNHPATILLVDDESAVRDISARVLRRGGYNVLTAESGPQAIRVMESHLGTVDLLLTDVVMPEMTGPDLALVLHARHPELRVIFCSGYVGDATVRDYSGRQTAYFLDKPFSVVQITAMVERVLSTPVPSSAPSDTAQSA